MRKCCKEVLQKALDAIEADRQCALKCSYESVFASGVHSAYLEAERRIKEVLDSKPTLRPIAEAKTRIDPELAKVLIDLGDTLRRILPSMKIEKIRRRSVLVVDGAEFHRIGSGIQKLIGDALRLQQVVRERS